MKIVCLNGSPKKKGNTATMIEVFCETADELGANTETIHLNSLSYRGCQGCGACKGKLDHCVLKDDLAEVLDKVKDADVLLMGSPIYFGEVTSQMKGFIDRTYSYLTPDFYTSKTPSRLDPDKTLIMFIPQGAPDAESFCDVYPRYASFFKWFGYEKRYEVRGLGMGAPEDVLKNDELLEQIRNVAREILG